MVWESDYFEDTSFVTLTLDDDHLPLDRSVCKDTLQRFFKRLRKDIEPRKIKYFACGEYGEQFGRPHYHAVIFGLNCVNDADIVKDNWGLGNVSLSIFKPERARYTAGYLLKEVDSNINMTGCTKPFAIMSKKLGLRYCMKNANQIINSNNPLTLHGSPVATPRYFRKKLDMNSNNSEYLTKQRDLHKMRIGEWKGPISNFDLQESFEAVRKQVGHNLAGKQSIKRDNDNGL